MTEAEFLARVKGAPGKCWPWPGAHNGGGYGELRHDGRKVRAHRLAYELEHGAIPSGLQVRHSCDDPRCCNPAHLLLGTPRDNAQDRERRHRGNQPNGERNARASLSDEQVVEIRERRGRGEECKSIAADLGVHPSYVSRVARGVWRATPTRAA